MNVPGIVGLGVAAELARRERARDSGRETDLKQKLITGLLDGGADLVLNVPAEGTLPQTISARFRGVSARALMHATREQLAFSSGSACATTKVTPSHVLLAQGLSADEVAQSVRLSFGRLTSKEEIEAARESLLAAAAELRRVAEVS